MGESITTLSKYEVNILVKKATHNGNAKKMMLGKYVENSPTSYNIRAGKDYTFFEMKDDLWKETIKKVNKDDDEIWKINQEFIDQQLKKNKEIFLSHDPYNPRFYKGFYKREIDYLTIDLKYTIKQLDENLWKIVK